MNEAALQFEVWSDYACPYCFLACTSLAELVKTRNVNVAWRAYELRPSGSPSPTPEFRARIEASLPALKTMARERYGVELNPAELFVNTRKAHMGAKFADEAGAGAAYHARVMRAYWQEGLDIGDEVVLTQLAREVGLDVVAFGDAIHQNRFDEAVQAEEDQAAEYGLEGVPAMVVNKTYLIVGAQPLDVLQNEVDEICLTIK